MESSGNADMYQFGPDQGYGAATGVTSAAAAGVGARAFVPPADNNVQPYADDFITHNNQAHLDDGYYYSPTTATSAGAGYSQNGDSDFYDRYQPTQNNNYYGYQDGHTTTDYSDHAYHTDGYSDSPLGAGAAIAGASAGAANASQGAGNVGDKTYMFTGEHNDPRRVFGKPDARE